VSCSHWRISWSLKAVVQTFQWISITQDPAMPPPPQFSPHVVLSIGRQTPAAAATLLDRWMFLTKEQQVEPLLKLVSKSRLFKEPLRTSR
ncbi:hypothetical protein XENOCAPTIV_020785, partial [Xenoophorus captivus]